MLSKRLLNMAAGLRTLPCVSVSVSGRRFYAAQTKKPVESDKVKELKSLKARPLYLDAQATSPLDPRVLDAMLPYMTNLYGNPHSRTHAFGWESELAVEKAREVDFSPPNRIIRVFESLIVCFVFSKWPD